MNKIYKLLIITLLLIGGGNALKAETLNLELKTKNQDLHYHDNFITNDNHVASMLTASAAANSVSYVDYTWSEESKTLSSETKSVDTYTEITSTTTEMTSGWYVVNGEVTVAERMTATGEVHLILADGAHLTASLGITVNEGNSLYIYGQSSNESTMGRLTATTTSNDAAIGSLKLNHAGTIVINGGNINASTSGYGAGIGGAENRSGYQITINAGVVTATSSKPSAAIGSGHNSGYGDQGTVHSICINGGVVNATMTDYGSGAAIGGGDSFDGGDITITGGTVTATSVNQGAAIGGGKRGSGGNITITGGNVTATYTHSVYNGVAIGAGYYGESAGNILITGGTVTATSKRGCGIGVYNGDNGRIVILGGTVNASGSGNVHINAGASGSMMLVDGTTVTISGDFTLQTDFVLPEGYTLEISEGATLTIPEGVTLTLPEEYTLVSNGTVNAVGTVNCISHKYVEGVCICGLECNHVGGTPTCTAPAVCTTCGTGYGEVDPTNHNWGNGVCTYGCNTIHEPHDWSGKDGICTVCGATCTHTGGTATCKEQAKCELCGVSYGELADHTGGTATCQTQAVCEVCKESYGELDPNNHEYEKNNGICCETYQPAELNESGYYEIGNAGQLFWFANHINTVDRTASAVLVADIDLENRPWTPIGSTGQDSNNFRGHFDGQNHTIKGLYVEGGRAGLGFFGEVRTGTVKNFTIYGEVIVNTQHDYVGGVIGSICGVNGETDLERNGAIIQNITSYVNLTAKAHGVGMIGGFVGYANHQSLIENCSWYGTFDAGIYRVDSGAGGFIGRLYDTSDVTVRNCAAYGTIKTAYKSGTFENYSTIYIGGFLSYSPAGAQTVMENNLWAGQIEDNTDLTIENAHLSAYGTLSSDISITNCYAVDNTLYVTTNNDNTNGITTVTAERLASGEIAYLLQGEQETQVWGQNIDNGETKDAYPILGGAKVYEHISDFGNIYSNIETLDMTPHGKCGDYLYWNITDNTLTIFGTGAMYDYAIEDLSPWYTHKGSLKTLVLEEGMTYIGKYAFYNCSGFTENLIIPNSVTSIGRNAFSLCYFTGSLIIPNSVTYIGNEAFNNCYGLTDIFFYRNESPTIYSNTFIYLNPNAKIYAPVIWESFTEFTDIPEDNLVKMPTFVGQQTTDNGQQTSSTGWVFPEGQTEISAEDHVAINAPLLLSQQANGQQPTANSLKVKSFGYCGDGTTINGSITIEEGGQLYCETARGEVTVRKEILGYQQSGSESESKWYTIASPLKEAIDLSNSNTFITSTPFDLYRYDEPSHTWQNAKPGEGSTNFQTIEPGRGYLYANAENTTLEFTGNINTEDVNYTLTAQSEVLNGFHLVGNPYTHDISFNHLSADAELANGYYVLNGEGAWGATLGNEGDVIKVGQGALIKTTSDGTLRISKSQSRRVTK